MLKQILRGGRADLRREKEVKMAHQPVLGPIPIAETMATLWEIRLVALLIPPYPRMSALTPL